jgi:hypothetical protein
MGFLRESTDAFHFLAINAVGLNFGMGHWRAGP